MEIVLIDSFIVPAEAKAEFHEGAQKVQSFIRSLPGFVEGYVYEQKGDESRYNVMTTAVWENETAFENAKVAVANMHQQQGANPQANLARLKIERVRAIYEREPY